MAKLAKAMNISAEVAAQKENVTEQSIDKTSFETTVFREFFGHHSANDIRLYRAVKHKLG